MDGTIRTKSYTVDRKAYVRALWTRGLSPRLAALGALILVFAGVAWYLGGFLSAVGALGGGLIPLPILVGVRFLLIRRTVASRDMNTVFDDPRTMLFDYDGLMLRTQGGIESRVPWTKILKIERRGGFTLLFMTKLQHFIVPDDAFASEGDRRALDDLMRARELPGT